MIALLQRVSRASVTVDQQTIGQIGHGLLVFAAFERDDGPPQLSRMVERIAGYRIFPDGQGKMNLSVLSCAGSLLLVPQFTLAADTHKGMRPSFTPAAAPERGERLFADFVTRAQALDCSVQTGQFGATMQIHSTNEGPTTFVLRT